ncbi:GNAT family N-acetyltransferase [Ktedonospora formicarum]|uniref:N-acetyltransferase n=1 Tax=Ktedonospora formicarum TaxID=2778364 RepID=A0A8J3N010_9CHLR|nr:GNAT family N-acetyltransferase [Ktedonospora formicarum]GHO51335.1 N-acetyltransferase [Ktedonospora formicarum]
MEKHLILRNAHENERKIIRDITIEAYAEYQAVMPLDFWTRYRHNLIVTLDGEGTFDQIVVEQNGSIIGSVSLYPPAADSYKGAAISIPYPEVRHLAVLLQARGQGIGTVLMKECERRARETGAQAIGLHTAEVMQTAIRMYERLGFVRTPETDFQPSEGVVVLGYRHTF